MTTPDDGINVKPQLCLLGALLIATTSVAWSQSSPVEPVPRGQTVWMTRHSEIVETIQQTEPRMVLIGDSITHFWAVTGKDVWEQEFDQYDAVNAGIAGDRTQHVLWRVERMFDGVSPELAIIQIGTNNLTAEPHGGLQGDPPQAIADGVVAVVNAVRKELPNARILLLGLFPRADLEPEAAAQVGEVNMLLARTAFDGNTVFKDIGAVFVESAGTLSKEVMWDLLHLTEEGYRRWAEAIREDVAAALDEPAR